MHYRLCLPLALPENKLMNVYILANNFVYRIEIILLLLMLLCFNLWIQNIDMNISHTDYQLLIDKTSSNEIIRL